MRIFLVFFYLLLTIVFGLVTFYLIGNGFNDYFFTVNSDPICMQLFSKLNTTRFKASKSSTKIEWTPDDPKLYLSWGQLYNIAEDLRNDSIKQASYSLDDYY